MKLIGKDNKKVVINSPLKLYLCTFFSAIEIYVLSALYASTAFFTEPCNSNKRLACS